MKKSTYISLLGFLFVIGLALGLVFWNLTENNMIGNSLGLWENEIEWPFFKQTEKS